MPDKRLQRAPSFVHSRDSGNLGADIEDRVKHCFNQWHILKHYDIQRTRMYLCTLSLYHILCATMPETSNLSISQDRCGTLLFNHASFGNEVLISLQYITQRAQISNAETPIAV